MLRASKQLLQKRVRPVIETKIETASKKPSKQFPKVTPTGFAFVLGGLAFGSYIFKPSTQAPTAAMDSFKPNIAIIFGIGNSQGRFKAASHELGFDYIDVNQDFSKLDELVKLGKTKFFIEGFKDSAQLESIERDVVQPDLLLQFGTDVNDSALSSSRLVSVADEAQIKDTLKQRNLL